MRDLDAEDGAERLGDLVDEFLDRWRSGEPLTVEGFAAGHPEVAGGIESLLPVALALEARRSSPNEGTPAPLFPVRLGEYQLVRELGRGGMGVVFEAIEPALDRRVAVKVLPDFGVQDEGSRERFLREARIIARLRHPRIVPIHTIGEQDGMLYYAMDLIPGTSLDQLAIREGAGADGPGRARWVAGLGIQAAETLAYAHGQGVLHRDVKPSNFLLDPEGTLWLTDFGLARILDEPALTATGQWLGTLRYLAPEGLRGESSPRSDVYGLGLTLYELLVDVPAFAEPDRARLLRRIGEPIAVPPRVLDPAIPRDLETIVLKASDPAPERRYESADALAEDLRRFLDGRPIHARRLGAPARMFRWIRRNPAIAVLSAIATTLAILLVVLMVTRQAGSARPASDAAPTSKVEDEAHESSGTAEAVKDGPPWGYGRRHAPMGPGAGMGRGPRGPRRGMGPP